MAEMRNILIATMVMTMAITGASVYIGGIADEYGTSEPTYNETSESVDAMMLMAQDIREKTNEQVEVEGEDDTNLLTGTYRSVQSLFGIVDVTKGIFKDMGDNLLGGVLAPYVYLINITIALIFGLLVLGAWLKWEL